MKKLFTQRTFEKGEDTEDEIKLWKKLCLSEFKDITSNNRLTLNDFDVIHGCQNDDFIRDRTTYVAYMYVESSIIK